MILFGRKDAPPADLDAYLIAKTRSSAVREFPGIARPFISSVNFVHKFFFVIDDMLKNLDLAIQYLVLSESL
jgi:hypothetical protein